MQPFLQSKPATLAAFLACVPLAPSSLSVEPKAPEWRKQTHVYKTIGTLEIKADVHRPDDATVRPGVVWIHGGALIMGSRHVSDKNVRRFVDEGYVLISIDYRLAPESKLPAIIEDLEDAFRWVREKGPGLFNVDPARIGVWGASAGGYLTLVSGYRVQPPPQVLVSVYGYGELIGNWYSTPSPHPVHNKRKLSEAEARLPIRGYPVSEDRARPAPAADFYNFCRQTGRWPKEVSGWDPFQEKEKFNPYMPLKNISPAFPPTILLHGTADTDVPFEQSVAVAGELKKHQVPHTLISLENGEHGFGGADPAKVREAVDAAHAFLARYLKK